MSTKVIKIKDAQVTITTKGEVSCNREYRKILEDALKSDDLKDPRIKEVYVFSSDDRGKIYKYPVKYCDESGMVNIGPFTIREEDLHQVLSRGKTCISMPFQFCYDTLIFLGLTEEEVRRKVTYYYTGL